MCFACLCLISAVAVAGHAGDAIPVLDSRAAHGIFAVKEGLTWMEKAWNRRTRMARDSRTWNCVA